MFYLKLAGHVTPLFTTLEWFLFTYIIGFKLLSMAYKALCLLIPAYLTSLLSHHFLPWNFRLNNTKQLAILCWCRVSHLHPSFAQILFKLLQGTGGSSAAVITAVLSPASGSLKVPCEWSGINNGRQYMASPKWMTLIESIEGIGLMLKVTATGSTHAEYFPHKKYKRACKSSTPPYDTYHTPRAMLYFFF